MNHPDEAVERVLKGLREAEVPQGMDRRVLEAVSLRSAQDRGWRFAIPAMLVAARPWVLTAGVAVIALAAALALHRTHPAQHDANDLNARQAPQAADGTNDQAKGAGTTRPTLERAVLRSRRKSNAAKLGIVSDEDFGAVSEMSAPSHPAPPMPLTAQERLLVRLVHKGDPVEMAMLDPKVRSSALAGSKAEFDAFFAQLKQDDPKSAPETKSAPVTKPSPATKPIVEKSIPDQVKEEDQ